MDTKYSTCRKGAFYISLVYFIAALLWIVLSDYAISLVVENQDSLILIEMYKGAFFVAATTIVLYFLTYGFFRTMKSQYDENLKYIAQNREINENLQFSQSELSKHATLLNTDCKELP